MLWGLDFLARRCLGSSVTWQAFRRRFTAFVLASASRYASTLGVRDLLAANLACAWAIRASLLAAGRRP